MATTTSSSTLNNSSPTFCFLDTNVLIHKQTFDEVDWPTIVGAPDICLVLAPVVVKELDRHKNEGKSEWIQNRARTLTGKLKSHRSDPLLAAGQPISVGPHLHILYLIKQPIIDWATLELDATWNDDRLIASIIEFARENPDANVVFVTDDTLGSMNALVHGIQTMDAGRIPSQARTAPEAIEIERLRRQIQDLTNRRPKLELHFFEGGQRMLISCRSRTAPALSDEAQEHFIAETLAREQDRLDAAMTRGRTFLADNKLQPNDLERYEQEYTAYLHRLPAWLPMKWSREQGPVVDLWFVLNNTGTQPATDVRLTLTFPYGSFVTPRDEEPEIWGTVLMPERPEAEWMKTPPANPLASLLTFAPSLTPSMPLYLPTRPAGPPKPTGPVLSLDTPERHIVTYSHPKLIQGGDWAMAPIHAYLPPSTSEGFQIEYRLRADELPTVITETLIVKFTSDATSPSDG